MELLETLLHSFVNLAMLLFEYIGVGVITYAGIQGLVNYVRKAPDTRLVLAQGLAMGLEFKLGSEILRTVVVRSLSEIAIVGSIIALRAVLTILIHWEIKNEVNEKQMPGAAQAAAAEDTDAAAIPSTPKNDSENVVPVENTDTDASTDEAKASNSSDNAEKILRLNLPILQMISQTLQMTKHQKILALQAQTMIQNPLQIRLPKILSNLSAAILWETSSGIS